MRSAARLVGLRAIGSILRVSPESLPRTARERIAVMRPDHLGDVLLSTPALRVLRQREPDAEIIAIVGGWSAPILAMNPDVDRVLTYAYPWFDRQVDGCAIVRLTAAASLGTRLRALGIERVYILRDDHWWGGLAGAAGGVPRRYGVEIPESAPFLTDSIENRPNDHVSATAVRVVGGADDATYRDAPLRFEIAPAAIKQAARLLDKRTLTIEEFALIHPGASAAAKIWSPDRWSAIIEFLFDRGVPALVVGGPGDSAMVDAVVGQSRATVSRLEESPSIGVLGGLIQAARVALGVDSLAAHIAAAVDTPSIRLFGPGDERRFGPWASPARHRSTRAPGTRPDNTWFSNPRTRHPTMQAIEADQVKQELADLLTATS